MQPEGFEAILAKRSQAIRLKEVYDELIRQVERIGNLIEESKYELRAMAEGIALEGNFERDERNLFVALVHQFYLKGADRNSIRWYLNDGFSVYMNGACVESSYDFQYIYKKIHRTQ